MRLWFLFWLMVMALGGLGACVNGVLRNPDGHDLTEKIAFVGFCAGGFMAFAGMAWEMLTDR